MSVIHDAPHPLAGKTVRVKANVDRLGGSEFRLEDWWDRIAGKSWMHCDGNPACLNYAVRGIDLMPDDDVVYGKIGAFGHLMHVSELDLG